MGDPQQQPDPAQESPQSRKRRLLAGIVGLLGVAFLLVITVLRWSVSTDITAFLAEEEDAELAAISGELADSELTRAWILTIGGEGVDESEILQAASELRSRLGEHPEVSWVQESRIDDGKVFADLYFPRRFYFASDRPEQELPGRLSDEGLAASAQELIHQFSLPKAGLVKLFARADPLMLFSAIVRRLSAGASDDLRPVQDHLLTADGEAVLFLATEHSPFDSAAMAPLAAAIGEAEEAVNAAHGGKLVIEESAVARHALAAETSIRSDVTRISTISTIALLAVFLLMFRRLRLVLLVMMPLGVGVLAALAATLLLFGSVHGLTLAFGATLIGVAIDYPVHFLNHHMLDPDPAGPGGSMRRIWPGLRLGALTTVAGFIGLAWTSFPGLREMAVFACVGVLAALLSSRFLLPELIPRVADPGRVQRAAAAACARLLGTFGRSRRLLAALLLVVVGVTAGGLSQIQFVDDIRAFSQIDASILEEDERVRERVSRMDAGRFVIALGDDDEAALVANDEVFQRLRRAKSEGELTGFRSLHTFLWSADLQRRSFNVLHGEDDLAGRLDRAYAAAGFNSELLTKFTEDLDGPQPAPLTFADLQNSPLAGAVRSFRVDLDGRVGIVTMVRGVRDGSALAARLADLQGVHYFDQARAMATAYGRYRQRTIELVLVGLVAVFVMIAVRYRRLRLVLAAFLPAVLAAAATLALLSLAGISLHLLHIVALLLVLSMGVDYGIFLVESRDQPKGLAASVLSVVLAALSTVLAFGLLGMSTYPALEALGLTIGVGVLLSLVLAPLSLVLFATTKIGGAGR